MTVTVTPNQPNYLTIAADGSVSANFSGKISASELDLIAGGSPSPIRWITVGGAQVAQITGDAAGNLALSANSLSFSVGAGLNLPAGITGGTPNPSSKINWTRQAGGLLATAIWASDTNAGNQEPVLVLETSSLGDLANIWMAANSGGSGTTFAPTNQGLLRVESGNNPGQNNISIFAVRSGGGNVGRVLLDDLGRSGYIQNTGTSTVALNTGNSSFVGNGAANITFNIAHGLGRVPAFFTVVGKGWQCICNYQDGNSDATNASVQLQVYSGVLNNGQNFNYTWLAIG